MDLTCQISEDGSSSSNTNAQAEKTMAIQDEPKIIGAQEEYDPSQPLDSSDEEEHGTLSFEKVTTIDEIDVPPEPELLLPKISSLIPPSSISLGSKSVAVLSKEPDIDLNSIPMPSDEYRRPTIQFSIPTRHRLMSISSLIKRQKGVMKKQDKGSGSGLSYNSEVSKAFHTSDVSGDNANSTSENDDDERPKISLVQEIFGSDDEENSKDQEDEVENPSNAEEVIDINSQPFASDPLEELEIHSSETLNQSFNEELNKRWKTVAETVEESIMPEKDTENLNNSVPIINDISCVEESEETSQEIRISIKPSSELMEKISNEEEEEDSPDLVDLDYLQPEPSSDSRGKENKQIQVLECVSEEDTDFEVTYVGIGKANITGLRHPGKMNRRNQDKQNLTQKKKSLSPFNGFEEGEIIEQADRKKKKAKKKKSKKRKRSKDSRMSSKINSERSTADSAEKKSFSENSDSKEVSWKKPKMTKARNYRNGKRESEEKYAGDRSSKHDDSYKKGRSPSRHSGALQSSKSRSNRSLSNGRYRSRSRSGSRDSLPRWESRSRGSKRISRDESYRSRSSVSNHSSHSRSRSLTKRKGKRRHSPSPARKHRNGRSTSRSSHPRSSKSPRPRKRNRSSGNEMSKHDKVKDRTSSPTDTQSSSSKKTSSKSSSSKTEDLPPVEEIKKKGRKEKTSTQNTEDVDKEKKKRKKRREKSISPVKAIVADGDSIVVSLSFQKAKEDVARTPKVTTSTKNNESSSEKDKSNSNNNNNNNNNNNTDQGSGSERKVSGDYVRSSPRKGTILINLDSSPIQGHDFRRSPDIIVLEEYDDLSKKSLEGKKGGEEQQKSENKNSGSSQRTEGLDFVSSSHDCSADNTRTNFSAVPEAKAASPAERATSASKSPYKFSEYFVSSTCDVGKTSSPALESSSPKRYTPVKSFEPQESSLSQQISHSSPFHAPETPRPSNSTENGPEKVSTPSPESSLFTTTAKTTPGLSTKPMIGNIPGLFPSGFSSSGIGGMVSTAPIVIPAPPRIIPNANPTNLLNPNVLVSVASALYAPLLAAKQHQNNSSNATGQQSGTLSNLPRHSQPGHALFSKNQNSLSQSLGLFNNNNRPNNGSGEQGDSPFSPNSSDGDDLFEPPGDGNNIESSNKKTSGTDSSHHQTANSPAYGKYSNEVSGSEKRNIFDTLFSSAPSKGTHTKHGKKRNSGHQKKMKQKKGLKRTEPDKNGEGEMSSRLTEEVPTSAVALKMKEKFLKKLNRQERVVEEVKLSLKPHYSKKHITKEEYKDILRKAVPKICHNKSGEINPNKIKELVEAYVKKFRKTRKVENKAA